MMGKSMEKHAHAHSPRLTLVLCCAISTFLRYDDDDDEDPYDDAKGDEGEAYY